MTLRFLRGIELGVKMLRHLQCVGGSQEPYGMEKFFFGFEGVTEIFPVAHMTTSKLLMCCS